MKSAYQLWYWRLGTNRCNEGEYPDGNDKNKITIGDQNFINLFENESDAEKLNRMYEIDVRMRGEILGETEYPLHVKHVEVSDDAIFQNPDKLWTDDDFKDAEEYLTE